MEIKETKENKKEMKQMENEVFKERFQFILQINDNIICQRYFKINGFSKDAVESEEFKEVMDEVVRMIQNDLTSKSRVYDWYTCNEPIKLTGFVKDYEKYSSSDILKITSTEENNKTVVLENGEIINKTYFKYPDELENTYADYERPEDNEFVFKFSFLVDDKVMYERVWDGNVYHKYVRNSVDLTNSDVMYKDIDPLSLHFNVAIVRYMTIDKNDLTYHIIKKICSVLSSMSDENVYTKKTKYGDKTYYFNTYNKNYVNGWREAVVKKTNDYLNRLYPTQNQLKYVDKYL